MHWIKLSTETFNDEAIRIIDSMPDGDSVLVVWFKLLCLAGSTENGGRFRFRDMFDHTAETLAPLLCRPVEDVEKALQTLVMYGLLEVVDGTITIPKWEKNQNYDVTQRKALQNRDRQRRYRERKAAKAQLDSGGNADVTRNAALRERYITPLDTDIDIEEEKEEVHIVGKPDLADTVNEVIEYLNEKTGKHYRPTTGKTRRFVSARLSEGFTADDFKKVIDTKVADWGGDPNMDRYLRPETLFGTKFEGYLNEKEARYAGAYD